MIRLNKFMALSGIDSRRKCDEIIAKGRVKVNARVVKKMGVLIDPIKDIVTVDERPVRIRGEFIYLILNKPIGTVTTVKDPEGRRTVMDCLPKDINKRIWPVGRLDYNTSGLLIFTNDGDTAQKLIHPSFEIDKVYHATVNGELSKDAVEKLESGVDLGDFVTSRASVKPLKQFAGQTTYEVTIHEGKNRQVRRMFEAVGFEVIVLKRVAFGKICLGDLPVGKSRLMNEDEKKYIFSL